MKKNIGRLWKWAKSIIWVVSKSSVAHFTVIAQWIYSLKTFDMMCFFETLVVTNVCNPKIPSNRRVIMTLRTMQDLFILNACYMMEVNIIWTRVSLLMTSNFAFKTKKKSRPCFISRAFVISLTAIWVFLVKCQFHTSVRALIFFC